MKTLRNYAFLFSVAGLIVILDQWTKELVRTNLPLYQMWAPWDWMLPYARIVHVANTGVAFGMFQGRSVLFSILSIIVSIAIIYYFPRVSPQDWPLRLAMGMQLGGALGNLIDRILQGHVTDFISVGDFAVFNIADASISVGVAVLILGVWLQERRQKKEAEEISALGDPNLPSSESTSETPAPDVATHDQNLG